MKNFSTNQMKEIEIPYKGTVLKYRKSRILLSQSFNNSNRSEYSAKGKPNEQRIKIEDSSTAERVMKIPSIVLEKVLKSDSIYEIFENKYKIQCSFNGNLLNIRGSQSNVEKFLGYFNRMIAKNISFTHYISIPLKSHAELSDSVERFKNEVITYANESLPFISKEKLHVTILMLRLLDMESISKAKNVLNSLQSQLNNIVNSKNQSVADIVGVDVMKGSLKKANVLHACIYPNDDRLDQASRLIIYSFVKEKLANEFEAEMPKYHLTILNSKYYTKEGYRPFDATEIFQNYNEFEFAHLSGSDISFQLIERNNNNNK